MGMPKPRFRLPSAISSREINAVNPYLLYVGLRAGQRVYQKVMLWFREGGRLVSSGLYLFKLGSSASLFL